MRHFLVVALPIVALAPGVLQATGERFLKALSRGARALASRQAPARLGAIPLPMVAALTGAQLLVAPGAVEQSVFGLDDGSTSGSQKAGQRPSIRPLSVRDKTLSDDGWASPRRLEAATSGLHFFRARFPYRANGPRETHGPSPTRAPHRLPSREVQGEKQSDPRRRWIPNLFTYW